MAIWLHCLYRKAGRANFPITAVSSDSSLVPVDPTRQTQPQAYNLSVRCKGPYFFVEEKASNRLYSLEDNAQSRLQIVRMTTAGADARQTGIQCDLKLETADRKYAPRLMMQEECLGVMEWSPLPVVNPLIFS